MTDKKVDLKRDSTMQVTAKEGVKFLKDAGEETLLELQGLDKSDADAKGKPRMKRDSTMAVTAKEGQCYLKRSSDQAAAAVTTKGPDDVSCASDKGPKPQIKPKMAKFTTMMQTKKEGEAYLAAQGGDGDQKADEAPAAKKAKNSTNEKIENKKPPIKKLTTIQKTTAEGEELLRSYGHKDDNPDSDRRRTRSQTRGGPPPPPPIKKEKKPATDKSGSGVTRGRKGRPRKDAKKPDDESVQKEKSGEDESTTEEDVPSVEDKVRKGETTGMTTNEKVPNDADTKEPMEEEEEKEKEN